MENEFNDKYCSNLLYLLEQKFPNQIVTVEYKNKEKGQKKNVIQIKKLSKADQEEHKRLKLRLKELQQVSIPENIEEDMEIRAILDYISEAKLPIISHNGIFDLMHLYDKFYEPLPEKLEDFKKNMNALFPHIYDTKYMLSNSHLLLESVKKNTSLRFAFEQLYMYHSRGPSIKFAEECEGYSSSIQNQDNKMHEGGYDAFLTGFVFLQALKILKIDTFWKNFTFSDPLLSEKLAFFQNQIPLSGMRASLKLQPYTDEYIQQVQTQQQINSGFFYLTFVGSDKLQLVDFQKFFESEFGEVSVYLTRGMEYDFHFYFSDKEKEQQFIRSMKGGYKIMNINGVDAIIYSDKALEQKIRGILNFKGEEEKIQKIYEEMDEF